MAVRMKYAIVVIGAVLLGSNTGYAQYGTPQNLRVTTPTIEDAEPGRVPSSEVRLPAIYQRQPVSYRSDEAPGTIIIDTGETAILHAVHDDRDRKVLSETLLDLFYNGCHEPSPVLGTAAIYILSSVPKR